jgi:hypothetical protein
MTDIVAVGMFMVAAATFRIVIERWAPGRS